ncbi:alanine racemase [Pelistega suis]|uniref:alanine racemase n=1 Tax=Pelistega suis TaxID=1631957 RepID=UPI00211BC9A6|nr:alanine racemase [Pelistega suis]MCQ9329794.1 alanine racemase [Pelistega suis]
MPRPIQAIISTQAMAHNLAQVRARIGEVQASVKSSHRVQTIAIIKANAYGHGTLNALKGFAEADGLGMIDLEDVILCRQQGWQKPIILLEGFFHQADVEILQQYRVTTAVHSFYQIDYLKKAKIGMPPIDVMVKFNTGMNRLGFLASQAQEVLSLLKSLQAQGIVGRIGCMSHFANADLESSYVNEAAEQMIQLSAFFDGPLSMCNSAASIRYPHFGIHAAENWLRPGICLYGSVPFETRVVGLTDVQFKPTMTLMADIIAIQTLQVGDSVGYGSTFTADRPMKIAVVACGYADGYPRSAAENTPVTVDGQPASLVGRVSMDMLTIDITHLPHAHIGSKVVMWGEQGPSIDVVADYSNRIGYELMCGLTKRVPVQVI